MSRKLVNESDEPPGPGEKLDGNQLPSEVPKEPDPRNLVEREGIPMMIVPVIPAGGDGHGSDSLFWCFVLDESQTQREPPKSQRGALYPWSTEKGNSSSSTVSMRRLREGLPWASCYSAGRSSRIV